MTSKLYRSADGTVSKLYDPETGAFLYRGKKLGICAACQAKDYTYPVGALRPSYVFCRNCIEKHGARTLRKDANAALANVINQRDAAKKGLDEMTKRYIARFGTTIKWNI